MSAAENRGAGKVVLAVDCMGGDHGPQVTLAACAQFAVSHPDATLLLVGQPEVLQPVWAQQAGVQGLPEDRARIVPASEVVSMDDPVEVALRRKRDSSMRVAQAAVSAGNTGALMAVARYLLKTMEGIDRPAIAFQLPNSQGAATTVLDLGANVDCEAEHLLQFAVMGSALVSALGGGERPTVGLLNIGEEAIKGNEVIKQARELLVQAGNSGNLNFYGNVEGDDIFKGTTDIVVCDGFVGNVALKTSEGLAAMVSSFLKQEFARSWLTKLTAVLAYPVLKAFKNRVDHRRYNGAALLGVRGLVFKSHGSADALAFGHALQRAYDTARNNLIAKLEVRIQQAGPLLQQAHATAAQDAVPPAAE